MQGAAAGVEDGGDLVHAIGEGCGSWLVDCPEDIRVGDLHGVLSGLALAVVEVGRHRHCGILGCGAEVALGRLLHLGRFYGLPGSWCRAATAPRPW